MHFARTIPYAELVAGLSSEVEAGNVATTSHPEFPLTLYRYTQQCVFDRAWSPFSLMARGLILDHEARRVVATPFEKFFNYGENGIGLPDEPFTVTEKLDGSLGIIFYYRDEWHVATKGSFSSSQAQYAAVWLAQNVTLSALDPTVTYLAEIIYAANRIVVSYDCDDLVLLSGYWETGPELNREELVDCGARSGMRVVRQMGHDSLDGLLALAKTLALDTEGFVVRFASGLRIKIKGDEYCRIHRLISRVTPLAVYEMLVEGDDLEVVSRDVPEEFRRDIQVIASLLRDGFEDLLAAVRGATEITQHMDDKTLGLWLASQTDIPPNVARWIFPARKKNLLTTAREPGHPLRRKLFDDIRPTGNRLEGYVPSSAVNRFAEETA